MRHSNDIIMLHLFLRQFDKARKAASTTQNYEAYIEYEYVIEHMQAQDV
jgi:hypothetical protein